jgi:predicted metal-dependent peptidase
MMLNLSVANKRRHDYTDFLRKFMTTGEETVINMDEFDYVYYTYGMELYGNLPLIEPLEYKDSNSLHDFVIVIDTSESVSGPLVKAFVEHTFNIMSDFGNFSSDACVHIIQCDSKVQSDTKVTNVADVSRFVDNFTIKGLGGTDFRPAFDYIRDLRAQGELKSLKGIVYFTDGLGMFPERAPDYDVAFVFVDNDGDMDTPVPPWASKIIIDDEQLREL